MFPSNFIPNRHRVYFFSVPETSRHLSQCVSSRIVEGSFKTVKVGYNDLDTVDRNPSFTMGRSEAVKCYVTDREINPVELSLLKPPRSGYL